MNEITLSDWFEKGGVFMWPLLLASVIALGVILDRLFVHGRAFAPYAKTLERIRASFSEPARSGVPDWMKAARAPMTRIAAVYLQYERSPEVLRNDVLKREGERLLAEWTRHVRIISTIAQVSPLLGLLGTVYGLVQAFYMIQEKGGRVSPADLAGGIWEALITTVAGLIVAIPAFLAYQYFQSSTEEQARRMRSVITELDELNHHAAAQPGGEAGRGA